VINLIGRASYQEREQNVRPAIRVAAICASLALVTTGGTAQQIKSGRGDGRLPNHELLNAGTVTVITAPVGGAFAAMASDMANVLDDGDNLRVLPIIGRGSVQNLVDIMRLRNVDMGFVVSDALEFVRTEYNVQDIASRVRYIAKLFNNDVHIVARKEIKSIRDLAGKKIFSQRNLGYFSVRNIFNRLGIEADIDSKTDDAGGLQKMLNGEADAWIVSAGKVAPIIRNIKNEEGKFHLVPVPYDRAIQDVYLPSFISHEEYPNLVASGETLDTVAASTVLMVYNWPEGSDRYNRVAKFIGAFFGKIDQLQQPARHPRWRDTVLAATVPGLQRFNAAQDWLDRHGVVSAAPNGVQPSAEDFKRFISEKGDRDRSSVEEETRLYNEFLEWRRTKH